MIVFAALAGFFVLVYWAAKMLVLLCYYALVLLVTMVRAGVEAWRESR